MALETVEKNNLLDATTITHFSLHQTDPSGTGGGELTGGAPAYARKAANFNAAAAGVKSISDQPIFDIPSGSTVEYVGFWNALSGGTFLGSDQLPAAEVYAAQGTYKLTAGQLSIP